MTKYRAYSRRRFQHLLGHWLQRNLKVVVLSTIGVTVLLAVVTIIMVLPGSPTGFTWYVLGLLHAATVAIWLHVLHAAFLAHDREAIFHLRGAWGEENTRSELQRAKRKRVIWGWVDSISLKAGDVDHLVVTRRGGLVALDSKWRTQADESDAIDMARAANRAKLRAEGLTQTLLTSERRARHRSRTNPLRVKAAVVLWGPVQRTVPHGAQMDGVEFIAGRSLPAWLGQLEGEPIAKGAATDVLERLKDYRASVWENTAS